MIRTHKAAAWLLLAALAALLTYLGFRGYFHPELLLDFANHLAC